MWIGQTLAAENFDQGSGGTLQAWPSTAYTPWIPRGGDVGHFTVDVSQLSPSRTDGMGSDSTPQLTMTVQTKNYDEADSSAAEPASTTTSTGVATLEASGLKELVRLKFTLTDATSPTEVARVYCACFRALRPSWERNLEMRPIMASTPLVASSAGSVPAAPVG